MLFITIILKSQDDLFLTQHIHLIPVAAYEGVCKVINVITVQVCLN